MNIKIYLSKTSNKPVIISVDLCQYTLTDKETVISIDRSITQSYQLEIGRHDNSLYRTNNTVHDEYVIVNRIQIDNFWVIGDTNHWSTTRYDTEYINHLTDKQYSWELSKNLCNNTLFFNGSLDYTITTPIRGMFFK